MNDNAPSPATQIKSYLKMFVSRKKYIDLAVLCMREQKRAQDAEYQVKRLLADNDMLGRLVKHHKGKADRLEYQVNHPRKSGQFVRKIPITVVEFNK